MGTRFRSIILFIGLYRLFCSVAWSQKIIQSQMDSGWVSLFDGKSLAGFYSINRGDLPNTDLVNRPDGIFSVRSMDSVIRSEGNTRLYGTYPRSIEFQGQKRGMGEAWTISKIFVTTTTDPTSDKHKYMTDGLLVSHGGDDPNRQCLGSSNPFLDGSWNWIR
jgi:hypothetical protein